MFNRGSFAFATKTLPGSPWQRWGSYLQTVAKRKGTSRLSRYPGPQNRTQTFSTHLSRRTVFFRRDARHCSFRFCAVVRGARASACGYAEVLIAPVTAQPQVKPLEQWQPAGFVCVFFRRINSVPAAFEPPAWRPSAGCPVRPVQARARLGKLFGWLGVWR